MCIPRVRQVIQHVKCQVGEKRVGYSDNVNDKAIGEAANLSGQCWN